MQHKSTKGGQQQQMFSQPGKKSNKNSILSSTDQTAVQMLKVVEENKVSTETCNNGEKIKSAAETPNSPPSRPSKLTNSQGSRKQVATKSKKPGHKSSLIKTVTPKRAGEGEPKKALRSSLVRKIQPSFTGVSSRNTATTSGLSSSQKVSLCHFQYARILSFGLLYRTSRCIAPSNFPPQALKVEIMSSPPRCPQRPTSTHGLARVGVLGHRCWAACPPPSIKRLLSCTLKP